MQSLGDFLKEKRGDKSLSSFAEEKGIDKGYLSKVERNIRKPGPETLRELAKAYSTDYDKLMELCGYKEEEPIIIRRLKQGTEKMDEETQKKLMDIIRSHFKEYFDE